MIQLADRALSAIARGLVAAGVVCVMAMMGLTTIDVIARYAFKSPTLWADEVTSYLLIAVVFLGLAPNVREGGHIRIDVVTNLLSDRGRQALEVFAYVAGFVFSVFLLLGAWTRFENFWSRGTLSDSPLMTPMWLPMVPVLMGTVVLVLTMVVGLVVSWRALLSSETTPPDAQKES